MMYAMTLIGHKAGNHPQQTRKRGADDDVDDRGTKREFFDKLDQRFGFTLDVAAAPHNAKVERYFTREDDGLKQSWQGERVWCNPPWSDCLTWVRKAWAEWDHGFPRGGADLIVMLLPSNRTEQGWWQDYVEPFRDAPDGDLRVEFVRGRQRFDHPPDWPTPKKGDRPPSGSVLLIWESTR